MTDQAPGDTAPPQHLLAQIESVVVGNDGPIGVAVAAFLAEGHVLIEDLPGTGKTVLAKAMARSIGGSFGRIQGTADLLPSDMTGVSVLDQDTHTWHFRPGPLFNNVVLVDELNRATPRTQSALLEAMAEGQVTVDGETHPLPEPFLVVATQNPTGDLGTFPLVGGQRDRFLVSIALGLPDPVDERRLMEGTAGQRALDDLGPVAEPLVWSSIRTRVADLYLHPALLDYAQSLVAAIRSSVTPTGMLSTRAAIALVTMARGRAFLAGRDYVTPEDIQSVAPSVFAHRLIDMAHGDLGAARTWIEQFVAAVPVAVDPSTPPAADPPGASPPSADAVASAAPSGWS